MIGDIIHVIMGYSVSESALGMVIAHSSSPDEKAIRWKVLCQGQLLDVYEIQDQGQTKFYDAKRYTVHKLHQWLANIDEKPIHKKVMIKHRRSGLRYGDYKKKQ